MSLDYQINLGKGNKKWDFTDCVLLFSLPPGLQKSSVYQSKPRYIAMNRVHARVSIWSNNSANNFSKFHSKKAIFRPERWLSR